MLRRFSWILAVLASGSVSGFADTEKKATNAPPPNEVEVRFGDGSVVRMLLLQENLEVATRYGKLNVPAKEIQRIEFGVHIPDKVNKQVEEAIKRLGSDTFKDREAAANELVALGRNAYPALRLALKNPDLEVVRSAEAVMKRIREKVPAEQLEFKDQDIIQTLDFTIAGRIETTSIQARSEHFGDIQLKIADLRAIRWMAAGTEKEVSVDSTIHGGPDEQWLDTGVTLNPNINLKIAATGEVDLRAGDSPRQFITGPTGSRNFGRNNNKFLPGALIGRIGENGTPFLIGERYEEKITREGKLYLRINSGPWGDNQANGSFKVKIQAGF